MEPLMTFFDGLAKYQPQALAVLRIMTALQFMEHGTQKLFNFPVGDHAGALSGLSLTAGILEFAGGDAAISFCFIFLYLVFAGPGAWALDNRRSA
jgi:putative oxidoreductase